MEKICAAKKLMEKNSWYNTEDRTMFQPKQLTLEGVSLENIFHDKENLATEKEK